MKKKRECQLGHVIASTRNHLEPAFFIHREEKGRT
jgi:hypothetical protein